MSRNARFGLQVACIGLALVCQSQWPCAADVATNGTFRFATQDLPVGSTNTEYVTRILVANADGAVTFGVDALAAGLSLDSASGFITGRPTSTFNQDITFSADDGTNVINLTVNLQVNSSGGGGNAGATISTSSLAQGTVGAAYSQTITVQDGSGPFTFAGASLPPGLSLDGGTGAISGTPIAAGTYFMRISVRDAGESNNVVTVLPLTVLPSGSSFQFTTQYANSGEVGTPYYGAIETSGASGNVRYSISGLPPGLSVDTSTGIIGGTPTADGTFDIFVNATDSSDTISTNLSLTVLPSSTSNYYWDVFALPIALDGISYTRQPPILVATRNGTSVTYSASGLPPGISYNGSTGELTGTATEIGVYPATFTAADADSGETIVLERDFVVLPATGGDANSLPMNFWAVKQKLKSGDPGSDSWKGVCIYNDDRTAGNAFDPATESMVISLGSRKIEIDAGSFVGSDDLWAWSSPDGEIPVDLVKFWPKRQLIKWKTKNDTITDIAPSQLRHTLSLGDRTYRLDGFFDTKGVLKPALAYRTAAFVVAKAKITAAGGQTDKLILKFLLADPTFSYEAGVDALRLRLLDGSTALIDKTFTTLGAVALGTDKSTGGTTYKVTAGGDDSATDRLRSFAYKSQKGKGVIKLTDLDLAAMPPAEAQLGVELTIGEKVYVTQATFFEVQPDLYRLRDS